MASPYKKFKIQEKIEELASWRLSILMAACCLLGGTSQPVLLGKLPLYLFSLLIIGWAVTSKKRDPLTSLISPIFVLGSLFVGLFLLYLIPLPPEIWTSLPGRRKVVEGFTLTESELPWLAISLTPEDTLASIWNFLPPIAVALILILDLRVQEFRRALITIILVSFISVILGFLQLLISNKMLYIYEFSNFGNAVGFFSNANHFAGFLAMIFPICYYSSKNYLSGFASINLVFLAIGILSTSSMTGYILLAYVFLLSIFCLQRGKKARLFTLVVALIGITALLIDFFYLQKFGKQFIENFTLTKGLSRYEMYTTIFSIPDFPAFFGTGPGSFYDIYLLNENRNTMSTKFANQLHNDFLQITLELGFPGLIIMIVTSCWAIYVLIAEALKGKNGDKLKLIGAISVSSILIASMPDYPLRTISIGTLFVFFAILMTGAHRKISGY